MISTIKEWFRDKNKDREVPIYVGLRGGFYVRPEELIKSKKFKRAIEEMDGIFNRENGENTMRKTKQRNHLINAIDIIGQIKGHIETNTIPEKKYLGKLDHVRNCLTDYLHADEIEMADPEQVEHLLTETIVRHNDDPDLTCCRVD